LSSMTSLQMCLHYRYHPSDLSTPMHLQCRFVATRNSGSVLQACQLLEPEAGRSIFGQLNGECTLPGTQLANEEWLSVDTLDQGKSRRAGPVTKRLAVTSDVWSMDSSSRDWICLSPPSLSKVEDQIKRVVDTRRRDQMGRLQLNVDQNWARPPAGIGSTARRPPGSSQDQSRRRP
jgi:hypothetical protein